MTEITNMSTAFLSPEEMFDSIGPAYEEAFAKLQPQLDSIQWVLEQIQTRRPAKTLDLGCGTGRPVCSTLADAGHDVLGIDVSSIMIDDARTKVRNAKFVKADAFQMDLPVNTFDAVTVYFSLSAGSSRHLIGKQIERIYNSLRMGGVFVLATIPNPRDKVLDTFMGRPFIGSGLSMQEYIARIKDVGFDIIYHSISRFKPKAVEAGLCTESEVKEESHLFIYARKEHRPEQIQGYR